jgi:hypothetical protein
MKTKFFAILITCISICAHGGTEGHGGDPIRILFEDARHFASDRVLKALPCSFGTNISADVRNWILNNKQKLAEDISNSEHVWLTDQQSTCAYTQTNPQAQITFSFETCRPGVHDISDALKILVHESVHHFGFTDEKFPDKVADAIYNLGSNSACTLPPATDPFDPASCPGSALSAQELQNKIPLPNTNQIKLGEFNIKSRSRICYSENWCGPWAENTKLLRPEFNHQSGYDLIPNGTVIAQFKNNIPQILISGSRNPKYGIDQGWNAQATILTSKLAIDSGSTWWGYGVNNGGSSILFLNELIHLNRRTSGIITNNCMRLTATSKTADKDNLNNDIMVEYEGVILSNW